MSPAERAARIDRALEENDAAAWVVLSERWDRGLPYVGVVEGYGS